MDVEGLQFDYGTYKATLTERNQEISGLRRGYRDRVIQAVATAILFAGLSLAALNGVVFQGVLLTGPLGLAALGVSLVALFTGVFYANKIFPLKGLQDRYEKLKEELVDGGYAIDLVESWEGVKFNMLAEVLRQKEPVPRLFFSVESSRKIPWENCDPQARLLLQNIAHLIEGNGHVRELNLAQITMPPAQFLEFLGQFGAVNVPSLRKLVLPVFTASDAPDFETELLERIKAILTQNPRLETLATPRSFEREFSPETYDKLYEFWGECRRSGRHRLRDFRWGNLHLADSRDLVWSCMLSPEAEDVVQYGAALRLLRLGESSFLETLDKLDPEIRYLDLPRLDFDDPDLVVERFAEILGQRGDLQVVEGDIDTRFSEESKEKLREACKNHPKLEQVAWGDFTFFWKAPQEIAK